jgi:hypothetical protein
MIGHNYLWLAAYARAEGGILVTNSVWRTKDGQPTGSSRLPRRPGDEDDRVSRSFA